MPHLEVLLVENVLHTKTFLFSLWALVWKKFYQSLSRQDMLFAISLCVQRFVEELLPQIHFPEMLQVAHWRELAISLDHPFLGLAV